jgi:hypothetical protein
MTCGLLLNRPHLVEQPRERRVLAHRHRGQHAHVVTHASDVIQHAFVLSRKELRSAGQPFIVSSSHQSGEEDAKRGSGPRPEHGDSMHDAGFGVLLDQVELLQSTMEGRQQLREHLVRERDPALIRKFKSSLSDFKCTVRNFDFKSVYGDIGAGFIEAHHGADRST